MVQETTFRQCEEFPAISVLVDVAVQSEELAEQRREESEKRVFRGEPPTEQQDLEWP
jgi:hypothetical protein